MNSRILQNVRSLGQVGGEKQSSLQYNIWKYSIEQRLLDEMFFTVITCICVFALSLNIEQTFSGFLHSMRETFGEHILDHHHQLINVDRSLIIRFCTDAVDSLTHFYSAMQIYNVVIAYCLIAFATSICQRFLTVRLRENAKLQVG